MVSENKLKTWVEANIIDNAQKEKILEYEKTHNNGLFWRAATIIAGLLIGCGICLIVASNWDKLSTQFKIIADFALFGAILYGAYFCLSKGKKGLSELFLLLSFLMIAATIGLLGQTFNLDGGWRSFALFWALLGVPYALLSRSVLLNVLWIYIMLNGLHFGFIDKILDYVWENLEAAVLFSALFVGGGYVLEKFDEQSKRAVVMPYVFSKAFYIFAYIVVLFGAGDMGLGSHRTLWVQSLMANVFIFSFLGLMMLWGMKTQNILFFKRNAIIAEIYVFALFASRMGNLLTSGLGMIAGGLFILFLLYCLKRTSKLIGKMEVFK